MYKTNCATEDKKYAYIDHVYLITNCVSASCVILGNDIIIILRIVCYRLSLIGLASDLTWQPQDITSSVLTDKQTSKDLMLFKILIVFSQESVTGEVRYFILLLLCSHLFLFLLGLRVDSNLLF